MSKKKIVKAFGKLEEFSPEKLKKSLQRSGATADHISSVVKEISSQVQEGMTTKEIYRRAFQLLRQYSPPQAARYKLKQAINELGPSGFPFEMYVAVLLQEEGYKTIVSTIIAGHCVKHEIDVTAEKDEKHFMIECKFHNGQGTHCDVKIPLYIQSRFLDVERKWKEMPGHQNKFHQAWVFTNTRFTDDAIKYGTCMAMALVSWDYPSGLSLRDRINKSGLHPLTCLTTLTSHEKKSLLDKRIVLCKDICRQPELLKQIGITNEIRLQKILNEGRQVCQQFNTL